MDQRKSCSLLLFISLILLVITFSSGCTDKDGTTDLDNYQVSTETSNITDIESPTEYVSDGSGQESLSDDNIHTLSLKRTEILELDNGYSLKVLDVDKQEEKIHVSFRKDDNEYTTRIMRTGNTYHIKDTKEQNTIYTVNVNRILNNSFVVNITYTVFPEIFLESEKYEGKDRINDVRIGSGTLTRSYLWEYANSEFTVEYQYNTEAYDAYSERSRNRDFTHFVNDPYDDELISQITKQIGELAVDAGYDEEEIPYITMAFVQSLPYVSDSVSAGYDEYPRFPFETLYHGGGDCEDSAILLASLLYDMDYGVALIILPDHMAAGVKSEEALEGGYYKYAGTRYYYLETTNSGWDVGVIPDKYVNAEAVVVPISNSHPELMVEFDGTAKNTDYASYIDLEIDVTNVGSAIAEDVVIYTTLESTTEDMVWDDLRTDTDKDLDVDESLTYTVANLKIPAGKTYRVGIWTWGSNADSEYVYSDWVVS